MIKTNSYRDHAGTHILVILVTILPFGSVLGQSTRTSVPPRWPAILEVLNQKESVANDFMTDLNNEINKDLLAVNKSELQEIETSWALILGTKKNESTASIRQKKNEFFHQKIVDLNSRTLARVQKFLATQKSSKMDYQLLANQILEQVRKNPVAKLEAAQKYDQGGELGFCFGRALLVHYLLLKAGVKQEEIAKIFIAGDLKVGSQIWAFHVAIMVRDDKAGYLIIDPLHEKPMGYRDWAELMTSYDIKGKLSRARFYPAHPKKFLPSFGAYRLKELENPHLKTFFADLAATLAK